jgi:hypothetical protein
MRPVSESSEFRRREIEARDAARLITRCAFCRWRYTGTALEGRERALQHRLQAHPEARASRRRTNRHLTRYIQPAMSDEEEKEITDEIRRRAFLHGVDLPVGNVGY